MNHNGNVTTTMDEEGSRLYFCFRLLLNVVALGSCVVFTAIACFGLTKRRLQSKLYLFLVNRSIVDIFLISTMCFWTYYLEPSFESGGSRRFAIEVYIMARMVSFHMALATNLMVLCLKLSATLMPITYKRRASLRNCKRVLIGCWLFVLGSCAAVRLLQLFKAETAKWVNELWTILSYSVNVVVSLLLCGVVVYLVSGYGNNELLRRSAAQTATATGRGSRRSQQRFRFPKTCFFSMLNFTVMYSPYVTGNTIFFLGLNSEQFLTLLYEVTPICEVSRAAFDSVIPFLSEKKLRSRVSRRRQQTANTPNTTFYTASTHPLARNSSEQRASKLSYRQPLAPMPGRRREHSLGMNGDGERHRPPPSSHTRMSLAAEVLAQPTTWKNQDAAAIETTVRLGSGGSGESQVSSERSHSRTSAEIKMIEMKQLVNSRTRSCQ